MKLYTAPGSCSLAPHIALNEAGMSFDTEKVSLQTHQTESGTDLYTLNPNGYVPILELKKGEVLTEGVAMMQYIADQSPKAKLAPANGTMERYRLQEWLNFITTELHKGLGAFFNPKLTGEYAEASKGKLHQRFAYVEKHFAESGQEYLLDSGFSIADGYLFTVLRWTKPLNISLEAYPHLVKFMARVQARPAVQKAMTTEGIA